jgi:hypothetical protein
MNHPRRFVTERRVLFGIVFVLAVATRVHDLGSESLWLDEAITFHRSRLPLRELVADALKAYHNPAYFTLIHFWMKLGDDEFMLRLPSAMFGIGTVLFTFSIGRVAAGNWAGFGAALVLCLNPVVVEYDQEARMYALYSLGVSSTLYGIVWLFSNPGEAAVSVLKLVRSRSVRREHRDALKAWIAILAGSVVALYCHGTATLFLVASSIVALTFVAFRPERRAFLVNWALVNLLVVIAFLPWLPSLLAQSEEMNRRGFWISALSLRRVYRDVAAVLFFDRRLPWPLVVVAVALLGTFALRKKPLVVAALWLFTLLCPGLLALASVQQSVFMTRLILWGAIPFAVVTGSGLTAARWPVVRVACVLVYAGLAGNGVHEYYLEQTKPRWREGIQLVSDAYHRRVKVLTLANREGRLIRYYLERKTDPIPAFEYQSLRTSHPKTLDRAIRGAKVVWTIRAKAVPSAQKVIDQLEQRARRTERIRLGGQVLIERWRVRRSHKRRR